MNPLIFNPISVEDATPGKRYLANIRGDGLVFGSLVASKFVNEGYGYMDANEWTTDEIIALYEIPLETH